MGTLAAAVGGFKFPLAISNACYAIKPTPDSVEAEFNISLRAAKP